jgi:hypothetical protein
VRRRSGEVRGSKGGDHRAPRSKRASCPTEHSSGAKRRRGAGRASPSVPRAFPSSYSPSPHSRFSHGLPPCLRSLVASIPTTRHDLSKPRQPAHPRTRRSVESSSLLFSHSPLKQDLQPPSFFHIAFDDGGWGSPALIQAPPSPPLQPREVDAVLDDYTELWPEQRGTIHLLVKVRPHFDLFYAMLMGMRLRTRPASSAPSSSSRSSPWRRSCAAGTGRRAPSTR